MMPKNGIERTIASAFPTRILIYPVGGPKIFERPVNNSANGAGK